MSECTIVYFDDERDLFSNQTQIGRCEVLSLVPSSYPYIVHCRFPLNIKGFCTNQRRHLEEIFQERREQWVRY